MVHELPYDDPERLRRRLRIRYPIVVDRAIGLGRLPNARLQRGLARLPRGRRAQPLPDLGPLALVPRALRRPGLHPRPPPRALPARRAPARRRLRRRLRRLLRRPDRAALVGIRAGADRRGGAADHGRGRRGDLGRRLAGMYGALGGNPWAAMPSLHFATSLIGRDLARRSGPGAGRGRLGLRADARLRPRLPRRALRHRSRRRAGAGRRACAAASRLPNRPSSAVNGGLHRLERIANG